MKRKSQWTVCRSERHGRKYWHNGETGESRWEDPNISIDATASAALSETVRGYRERENSAALHPYQHQKE